MAMDHGNFTTENPAPSTEGATQTQGSVLWSQIESQPEESVVWGRLYGKHIKKKSLDLNTECFKGGRGENNDLILTVGDLPEKILNRISKEHFTIKRPNCDLLSPVYIEDLSRNGTFVNSEKIGRHKCRILQNEDVISLSHPAYKAFVFKDLGANEALGLPKEIISNYYVSRKLGSGACGLVRLIHDRRTCKQFAMKIVKKNMLITAANALNTSNDANRVLNEAKIMTKLQHPCVIRLHDIIDTPDSVYMVLEYMKGGDLLKRIINNKFLSEDTSKLYFYQMCTAVKYLHDKGITHRDLKPDNILLEDSDNETCLKISDFGLSKFVQNDSVMRTLCGTPLYVAPEILKTAGRGAYTKKVDVWSLGVVLFTCLSGTLPFSDEYGTPAIEQIKKGFFRFNHPSWKAVSANAISLIKAMLMVDPNRRPSIDDILNSKWLKDKKMLLTAKKCMKMDVEDEENCMEPPNKRSRK